MRARDISLFVICVSLAIPLIAMTDIFPGGPTGGGTGSIMTIFAVSALIGILAAGGVSIMGWSFKVPVVLTSFLAIYGFSATTITTLTLQMIKPWEVGTIFAGVFIALFAVVGYFAALEIAGGPHGPMA